MIKTYSYEKEIAEQIIKPEFPGAPGLGDRTMVDIDAFYHIKPTKMKNELRFIIRPFKKVSNKQVPEPFVVLYRYKSLEELFISQHSSNSKDDKLSRTDIISSMQFYYNGKQVYASNFGDVLDFCYQHLADKLVKNE